MYKYIHVYIQIVSVADFTVIIIHEICTLTQTDSHTGIHRARGFCAAPPRCWHGPCRHVWLPTPGSGSWSRASPRIGPQVHACQSDFRKSVFRKSVFWQSVLTSFGRVSWVSWRRLSWGRASLRYLAPSPYAYACMYDIRMYVFCVSLCLYVCVCLFPCVRALLHVLVCVYRYEIEPVGMNATRPQRDHHKTCALAQVCVCARAHAHMHARTHADARTCAIACTHAQAHSLSRTHKYTNSNTPTSTHTHTHTYAHTHEHTHYHTHSHTHTQTQAHTHAGWRW